MDSQYGDDFITLTDEDGIEFELEVLSTIEYQGTVYKALVPASDPDEEESLDVNILKVVEEDGEEFLVAIEDDSELEAVYELLIEQLYEEDEEE